MVASKLTRPITASLTITEQLYMTTLTDDEKAPEAQLTVFEGGASHAVFQRLREATPAEVEEVETSTDIPNPHPLRVQLLGACVFIRVSNDVHLVDAHFTVANLR